MPSKVEALCGCIQFSACYWSLGVLCSFAAFADQQPCPSGFEREWLRTSWPLTGVWQGSWLCFRQGRAPPAAPPEVRGKQHLGGLQTVILLVWGEGGLYGADAEVPAQQRARPSRLPGPTLRRTALSVAGGGGLPQLKLPQQHGKPTTCF